MMRKQVEDARQQFVHNLSFQFNYEEFFVMYQSIMRYGEEEEKRCAGDILESLVDAISEHYYTKKRQESLHMPSFYYVDKDSERRKRG